MFTIVKKLIYIDNKKHKKIKNIKLIKWEGDTCQISTRERKMLNC